jgi:predicted DNA-binding transcriptional regulator AlpA
MNGLEEMLSSKDIQKSLGVTRECLQRWIKNTDFPKPYKVVGKNLWKKSEIEAYIDSTRKNLKEDEDLNKKGNKQNG